MHGIVYIWKEIWKIPVRVQKLLGKDALVMPYLSRCNTEPTQEQRQLACSAIEALACAGFCHNDLHWRHVGLIKRNKTLKAVLFDLANVKQTQDVSAARSTMLNKLKLS